jgi:hypothetical protein
MFGFPFEVGVEPISVNVVRMIRAYAQGVHDLAEIYASFLSPATREELAACAQLAGDDFRIPDTLWVHVIYEFAVAHLRRSINRDHLMQSLVPLYLGRTASFVNDVRESNAVEVEERIEKLCAAFESEKPYLAERWEAAAGKEQVHAKPV